MFLDLGLATNPSRQIRGDQVPVPGRIQAGLHASSPNSGTEAPQREDSIFAVSMVLIKCIDAYARRFQPESSPVC